MSSTTSTKTKAAALAQVQAIIAGTTKHFPNGSFTIGGTVYTAASLIQVLQDLVSAMTARSTAQAGARDALAAEQAAQTQVGPILVTYKRIVLAAFANATQTLADFGLAPPGANAVDHRAAGRPGSEGQGHARRAWDDEQEAKARRQRPRDGSHRDPRHGADHGHAAGCTGFSVTPASPRWRA